MRRFGRSVLGFFAGGAAVFVGGMALPSLLPLSEAEGAHAMAVAFVWTPLGALAGAMAGALRPR